MRLGLLRAGGLALAMTASAASGADLALDVRGRQLAETLCARCHAIGPDGASPRAEAPPFRTFAERWPLGSLQEALAEGIVVGHADMPEFVFDPHDIDSLISYIDSVTE